MRIAPYMSRPAMHGPALAAAAPPLDTSLSTAFLKKKGATRPARVAQCQARVCYPTGHVSTSGWTWSGADNLLDGNGMLNGMLNNLLVGNGMLTHEGARVLLHSIALPTTTQWWA
jgi:hypothetical protein